MNSDYYVINSSFEFKIKRAENKFTQKLTADDIYEGDEPLVTEASFVIKPEDHFFRLTVRDAAGKHANTRFYYLDELK